MSNKNKLRTELTNLYGGTNKFLTNAEITTIVTQCYRYALQMLKDNKDKLEELKDLLIEEEIVDGEVVYDMLGQGRCNSFDCSVSFD